jgi:hypothetical protein
MPPEPGIGPATVAEPVISDDKDERKAQARCGCDQPQRHRSHVPEDYDIGVRGCQHSLHLHLVVLFNGQRLVKRRVQAG